MAVLAVQAGSWLFRRHSNSCSTFVREAQRNTKLGNLPRHIGKGVIAIWQFTAPKRTEPINLGLTYFEEEFFDIMIDQDIKPTTPVYDVVEPCRHPKAHTCVSRGKVLPK